MITPDEQQSRLDKVRALIAKAEATTFPAEAKAFMAKAQELMARWAIDDAMLAASKGEAVDVIEHTLWMDANEYRAPKIQLVANLCDVNDVKSVMFRQEYRMVDGQRKRQFRMVLVGDRSDVMNVETLYTSLLTQAAMAYLLPDTQAQMEMECAQAGHRIRWRNNYMMAFARQIWRLLKDAKDRVKAQAESSYAPGTMAMVLVGKSAVVQRRFEDLFPNCKKGGKTDAGRGFDSAQALGREAANRADLGKPKIGGNRNLLQQHPMSNQPTHYWFTVRKIETIRVSITANSLEEAKSILASKKRHELADHFLPRFNPSTEYSFEPLS